MTHTTPIKSLNAGWLLAVAIGAWPDAALACTLCYSRQASAIRARLFDADMWWTGTAVLLPILLLLLIVAAVAREPQGRGGIE